MATGATTSVRIYKAIKEACLSTTGDTKVQQFNLWNNQVEKHKDGTIKPIRYPFVGVEFEGEFDQLSVGRQTMNGIFILYICLENLDFDDESILTFKDELYRHLMYTLPKKDFMNVYRTFETQDSNRDNVLMWRQEYSFGYINDDAADRTIAVTPWTINTDVSYQH